VLSCADWRYLKHSSISAIQSYASWRCLVQLDTSILPSTKVSQDQRIHILSTKKEQNHSLDRLDKRRAIGRLIVQWIICTVMLLVATYAFLYAALLAKRRVKSAERGMAICVKSIVYPSNHRIP
jgi:hypothetical protein